MGEGAGGGGGGRWGGEVEGGGGGGGRKPKRRIYSCQPQKSMPGIFVTKDYSMYLSCNMQTHGPTLKWGPADLFGFNTGSWTVEDLAALKGAELGSHILTSAAVHMECVNFSCCCRLPGEGAVRDSMGV